MNLFKKRSRIIYRYLSFIGFVVLAVFGCKSTSDLIQPRPLPVDYEVLNSQFVENGDSISVYELRIYKIYSALDALNMMYTNFQKWDERLPGKYQDNVDQFIWYELPLFRDERTFTVIGDGTESEHGYFASLIIMDNEGQSCFNTEHPLHKEVLNRVLERIDHLRDKEKYYDVFK